MIAGHHTLPVRELIHRYDKKAHRFLMLMRYGPPHHRAGSVSPPLGVNRNDES